MARKLTCSPVAVAPLFTSRVGDVDAAVSGLLGAIIGGTLVVFSDTVHRLIERKTKKGEALRAAAADVIATYLQARARLIAHRESEREMTRDDLFPDARHLALARLFTLPGSDALRAPVLDLGSATVELIESVAPDTWESAYERQLEAIRQLEAAVRKLPS